MNNRDSNIVDNNNENNCKNGYGDNNIVNSNIDYLVCQDCEQIYFCELDIDECCNDDMRDNDMWLEMSYRKYTQVSLVWVHSELGEI